jgi:hypothetical protein
LLLLSMVLHLIIPLVLLIASWVLLPGLGGSTDYIGWISAAVGIVGGMVFWLLPFPTPPITSEPDAKGSRLWAVLPWWRSLLAAMLLALGLTAVHDMLVPTALYDLAHVWSSERGKDGDVVVVAADTVTRQAQGGEDEAVMRAQIGQTLCNLAECNPKGVLLLRVFAGPTEGDAILARGFEALGQRGVNLAYLHSPEGGDPPDLIAVSAEYPKQVHAVNLPVITLAGMTCGVEINNDRNPVSVLIPNKQEHSFWLDFGKPMHPLYSMSEFNQGILLSNRRDPSSEDMMPADVCNGRIIILTELLGGGLTKAYATPIAEAMPAHQFWALALSDALEGRIVIPLPGFIMGAWVLLWTALGTLVASGTRHAGMGIVMAAFAIVLAVFLLLVLHLWVGILPAAAGAILGAYITRRAWAPE